MENKILFLDVDGCLSKGRFAAFNNGKLEEVRKLIKSNNVNVVLASGRSQPYMEAMTQVLDLSTPYICENGANVFSSERGENIFVTNTPALSSYKQSLENSGMGTVQFEPGKDNSLSFRVLKDGKMIAPHAVVDLLDTHCKLPPTLQVTYSNSSVDVVPVNVSKRTAAEFLADHWQVNLQDCYGFGDSNNDIELLKAVGHAGAPANANQQVKQLVDFVSDYTDVEGLIDYLGVINH